MKLIYIIFILVVVSWPNFAKADIKTSYRPSNPRFTHTVIREYWDPKYKHALRIPKQHVQTNKRHNRKKQTQIFLISESGRIPTVIKVKQIK